MSISVCRDSSAFVDNIDSFDSRGLLIYTFSTVADLCYGGVGGTTVFGSSVCTLDICVGVSGTLGTGLATSEGVTGSFWGESGSSVVYFTSKADFSNVDGYDCNVLGLARFSAAILALLSSIGFIFFAYLFTPGLPSSFFPAGPGLSPPFARLTFFALFSIVLSTMIFLLLSISTFLSKSFFI